MSKESKKKEKEKDNDRSLTGLFATILIFFLLGLVGGLMLFLDNMKLEYFCYTAGGAFIAYGLMLIIRYFAKKSFLVVSNYDFSMGLGVTLCGVLSIIKASDLAKNLPIYLGIFIAIGGLITLQHGIQLFIMKIKFGTADLLVSALFILFSVILIMDFNKVFTTYTTLSYALILTVGIVGIISQIIVIILTKKYIKQEEKKAEEKEKEEQSGENPENTYDYADEYPTGEDIPAIEAKDTED